MIARGDLVSCMSLLLPEGDPQFVKPLDGGFGSPCRGGAPHCMNPLGSA